MTSPNEVTGANSRPAPPFDAAPEFGCVPCAPPSSSAAAAQFYRSADQRHLLLQ
jgi:hypothetical protein